MIAIIICEEERPQTGSDAGGGVDVSVAGRGRRNKTPPTPIPPPPTQSTSMYCTTTHEVITITEFCPEMNIDSIIDRFLTAWGKISLTTLINAWKLLFSAVDVSDDGKQEDKIL